MFSENVLLNILNKQELFIIPKLIELTICDLFVVDVRCLILSEDSASCVRYRQLEDVWVFVSQMINKFSLENYLN